MTGETNHERGFNEGVNFLFAGGVVGVRFKTRRAVQAEATLFISQTAYEVWL